MYQGKELSFKFSLPLRKQIKQQNICFYYFQIPKVEAHQNKAASISVIVLNEFAHIGNPIAAGGMTMFRQAKLFVNEFRREFPHFCIIL